MTEVPVSVDERPDGFWDRVRKAVADINHRAAQAENAPTLPAAPQPASRVMADAQSSDATPAKLQEALKTAWTYCEARKLSLSLLLVEIDAFKQFRADYGPLRAESLRAGVETAVRSLLPRAASYIGRHGIGRFIIVAPDCPILLARAAANRMGADVLAASAALTGAEAGVSTISVGVAAANPQGGRPATLLDTVEKALAKAKDLGHGRIESIDLRGDQADRRAAS